MALHNRQFLNLGRTAVSVMLLLCITVQEHGVAAAFRVILADSTQSDRQVPDIRSEITSELDYGCDGVISDLSQFPGSFPAQDRDIPGLAEEIKSKRLLSDGAAELLLTTSNLVDAYCELRSATRERVSSHATSSTELLHSLHRLLI